MELPNTIQEQVETVMQKYHPIFLTLSGSRIYGMANENSDYDWRGMVWPKLTHVLGLGAVDGRFEQFDLTGEYNVVLFNIQKFVKLALDNNPNILELLYVDEKYIYHADPVYTKLREHRDKFLSKKAFHTYRGYAHAQKHRIDAINKEVNQNKARLESVEKYGYDVKNASHMIRLMRQLIDILKYKTIYVDRTGRDSELLLGIRRGEYTQEQLLFLFDTIETDITVAEEISDLQHAPDRKAIDALLQEIMFDFILHERDKDENTSQTTDGTRASFWHRLLNT